MKTVCVAGATGLIGREAVHRLLARDDVQVVALARRPLPEAPRLITQVVSFDRLDGTPPMPCAAALCALGTTLKAAGSQEAFRAVDHDAVLAFARWARRGRARTFVLVSSVGADPGARNFYLRVKGETEAGLASLGFERLVVLRPSLLLGSRQESRPGEAVARAVMPALNHLLFGPGRKYRGIGADRVAAALCRAGLDDTPGRYLWHHDEIAAAAT